jgi:hypothetical protein
LIDNQLTDGGEVVSLTRWPRFTPRKVSGTEWKCEGKHSRLQDHFNPVAIGIVSLDYRTGALWLQGILVGNIQFSLINLLIIVL